MKMQIKQLEGNRWKLIDARDLLGHSVVSFMEATKEIIVCALFNEQEEKPFLFMSNDKAQVEIYKEKGYSFHSKDVLDLLGTEVVPRIACQTIPDAKFVELQVPPTQIEMF